MWGPNGEGSFIAFGYSSIIDVYFCFVNTPTTFKSQKINILITGKPEFTGKGQRP